MQMHQLGQIMCDLGGKMQENNSCDQKLKCVICSKHPCVISPKDEYKFINVTITSVRDRSGLVLTEFRNGSKE